MNFVFSALALMSLSFICAQPGAAESASALSALGSAGDMNISAPVPPAPQAAQSGEAQGDLFLWNEYLSRNFGGGAAREEFRAEKGISAAAVESVDLGRILNSSFKSGLTFRTSGNTVHISGAEALNCQDNGSCSSNDKYFLVFTTEKGQTLFVRAKDIANALFMSGSKKLAFPGDSETYTVKLDVTLTNPGASKLRIEGTGRRAIVFSLDDLTSALVKKGYPLKSGARHNLFYNTGIVQDPSGNGRFSKEKVLIFSPRGKDPNQIIRASQIGASGVLLPGVEKNLGFRIVAETLEIYKI